MKQMIVDYFTKQSGSENIVDHYVWLMDKHLVGGVTARRIVNVIAIDHKLSDHDEMRLMRVMREYIDEMDDAYCGRKPEEV